MNCFKKEGLYEVATPSEELDEPFSTLKPSFEELQLRDQNNDFIPDGRMEEKIVFFDKNTFKHSIYHSILL